MNLGILFFTPHFDKYVFDSTRWGCKLNYYPSTHLGLSAQSNISGHSGELEKNFHQLAKKILLLSLSVLLFLFHTSLCRDPYSSTSAGESINTNYEFISYHFISACEDAEDAPTCPWTRKRRRRVEIS